MRNVNVLSAPGCKKSFKRIRRGKERYGIPQLRMQRFGLEVVSNSEHKLAYRHLKEFLLFYSGCLGLDILS